MHFTSFTALRKLDPYKTKLPEKLYFAFQYCDHRFDGLMCKRCSTCNGTGYFTVEHRKSIKEVGCTDCSAGFIYPEIDYRWYVRAVSCFLYVYYNLSHDSVSRRLSYKLYSPSKRSHITLESYQVGRYRQPRLYTTRKEAERYKKRMNKKNRVP